MYHECHVRTRCENGLCSVWNDCRSRSLAPREKRSWEWPVDKHPSPSSVRTICTSREPPQSRLRPNKSFAAPVSLDPPLGIRTRSASRCCDDQQPITPAILAVRPAWYPVGLLRSAESFTVEHGDAGRWICASRSNCAAARPGSRY